MNIEYLERKLVNNDSRPKEQKEPKRQAYYVNQGSSADCQGCPLWDQHVCVEGDVCIIRTSDSS